MLNNPAIAGKLRKHAKPVWRFVLQGGLSLPEKSPTHPERLLLTGKQRAAKNTRLRGNPRREKARPTLAAAGAPTGQPHRKCSTGSTIEISPTQGSVMKLSANLACFY